MKTREWLVLETLNVVKRVLTKGNKPQLKNADCQYKSNSMGRKPTVKEMAKHPKLLRKQRARFGGV